MTVFTRKQHIYDTVWIGTEMKHFIFQVKTCKDAHITLPEAPWAPENSRFYLVIFGSWGNTRTELRRGKAGPGPVRLDTPNICSCNEFRPFWISWYNNTIAAGRGTFVGQQQIFSYPDPNPMPISALSFSSWLQAPGTWVFPRDSGEYWLKIECFQ